MKRILLTFNCLLLPFAVSAAPKAFERDVISTSLGPLTITCIGHGTLMLACGSTVIHVDPVSSEADYTRMPKAGVVLVTHEHGDHLDPAAIDELRTTGTVVIVTAACAGKVRGSSVLANGQSTSAHGIGIEAVPAYNIVHMRAPGAPYHPKGSGNGYVLSFGDTRVYIAGDTENTPEMKALKNIAVAFLPMNLPYTMTPAMVADAAKAFKPRILYPYHYGSTDPAQLTALLAGQKGIEVRIRDLR